MRTRKGKAGELKTGGYVMLGGEPCEVVSVKKSMSSIGVEKVHAEVVSLVNGEKQTLEAYASEELEYPILELKPAQVLAIGEKVTLFDLRNHSTIQVELPRSEELRKSLAVNAEVEYAEIAGVRKIIQVGLYDAHSYT
jgi:translation elongation factor P/translation initiation factor 5A